MVNNTKLARKKRKTDSSSGDEVVERQKPEVKDDILRRGQLLFWQLDQKVVVGGVAIC